MKTPSFLSPFLAGDSPKRLVQGLAVGAIATVVIGFGWGGWQLNGAVEKRVEIATRTATVAALAPICADRFEKAATANSELVGKFEAVSSWQRDSYLVDTGWATFAGGAEPDSDVAEACANMLNQTLRLN
jgi:hypothetical protein